MSGTGPRGRKARREQTVKRVRNPEGGTNRVWKPGSVDLRVDVAVGEANPMRVAGAAQDSGRDGVVVLEGKPKPMGVSGASVPDGGSRKTVWPSKRRDGSREPNIGYEFRDCSGRRVNPTRGPGRWKHLLPIAPALTPWRGHRVR
jgi:hypothetical protein